MHDGYKYHQKRTINGAITWQCSARRRNPRCLGTMVTEGDKIIRRREHFCKRDHLEIERKKLDYKWLMQIGSNDVSVPVIVKEMGKEYEENGLEKPSYHRVWKLVEKARKRKSTLHTQD